MTKFILVYLSLFFLSVGFAQEAKIDLRKIKCQGDGARVFHLDDAQKKDLILNPEATKTFLKLIAAGKMVGEPISEGFSFKPKNANENFLELSVIITDNRGSDLSDIPELTHDVITFVSKGKWTGFLSSAHGAVVDLKAKTLVSPAFNCILP